MTTPTVRLHRVLRTSPESLYRAFTDAEAFPKWLPPHGFTAKVHQMDVKVGGQWRMHFTSFSTGHRHSFGGTYHELEPGQRLRYSSHFDDPNLPGEMMTTVTFTPTPMGTELHVTQENIPAVIPLAACYLGWQESLMLLAQLVEANVRE